MSDIDERLTVTVAAWPSLTSLTSNETSGAISLSVIVIKTSVPSLTSTFWDELKITLKLLSFSSIESSSVSIWILPLVSPGASSICSDANTKSSPATAVWLVAEVA